MDNIPSWTSDEERALLSKLAAEVPDGGMIVEIGCLYGGSTYVLAKDNPKVEVISIDNFSWTPEGYPPVSAKLALKNLNERGIFNVNILVSESEPAAKAWKKQIDLCFIDGGHSFKYVFADLCNFAPFSRVLSLHDYNNDFWPDIKQTVDKFIGLHPEWHLTETAGMVAVLRRLE